MIKVTTEGRSERNAGIWKKIGIWTNEKIESQKRYELNEILGTERKEKKNKIIIWGRGDGDGKGRENQ
jgi:hypothetical protein